MTHGNGNADDGARIPERPTLEALREAAAGCRACGLWRCGTQTVFGEGATEDVRVMLVGEQPGDQEDRVGKPFVGPAGRLLDRALEAAGIGREGVSLTNVVKHFKWRPSPTSKRRIHQRPNEREIAACKPWVEAEIELLHPRALVCLGAIVAKALLGRDVRVTRQRGQRARDDAARRAALEAFVADLAAVGRALDGAERAGAGRLD